MKYLQEYAIQQGYTGGLAWWSSAYRRDASPLLDELAAVVDHRKAVTAGGMDDEQNLVTTCNKCNVRKSTASAETFGRRQPRRHIRGKYGEPQYWDGFSTLFVLLTRQHTADIRRAEQQWYEALTKNAADVRKPA